VEITLSSTRNEHPHVPNVTLRTLSRARSKYSFENEAAKCVHTWAYICVEMPVDTRIHNINEQVYTNVHTQCLAR